MYTVEGGYLIISQPYRVGGFFLFPLHMLVCTRHGITSSLLLYFIYNTNNFNLNMRDLVAVIKHWSTILLFLCCTIAKAIEKYYKCIETVIYSVLPCKLNKQTLKPLYIKFWIVQLHNKLKKKKSCVTCKLLQTWSCLRNEAKAVFQNIWFDFRTVTNCDL